MVSISCAFGDPENTNKRGGVPGPGLEASLITTCK